ncbi:MAG: T9SS type A sorting domain-containing protein [Saprospiraceae bacterium]
MKKLAFPCLLLALPFAAEAQTITWSEHVAPIVYKHCTTCHRPGEIAPFSLTSYTEAYGWANMMRYVTEIRYMPPWKPDPNFGAKYIGENYLSDDEVATIKAWVQGGAPQGNPVLEPPLPIFPTGSQVGTPDLVLSFAQKHLHPGTGYDEYRYFVLPTGLTQKKDLVALEMRPGNTKIVHHALFWADTSGTAAALDAQTPEYGYTGQGSGSGQVNFEDQLPGYVPGARPNLFTNGMAQRIEAGSDIVMQVHYAPTPTDEPDSSTVYLFFADQPATRFVRTHIMLPTSLVNGPFIMPPNTVREFHGVFKTPLDVSLLGVAPHCHLLGKNWRVFAVTPQKDTIPLMHIENWDFNWQGMYHFNKLLKLPKNTEIHAFATYDNTTNNPLNPNHPPQTVTWGESTTDEMYYLPLLWLPYLPGDENLSLDGSTTGTGQPFHFSQTRLYPVSPNPVRGRVAIGFTLSETSNAAVEIFDLEGRLLETLLPNRRALAGEHILHWDTSHLPAGLYNVVLRAGDAAQAQKVVVP